MGLTLVSVYFIGLGTTHLYRTLILRWEWTQLKILQLVPRIMLGVLGFSVLFQLLFYLAVTAFVYHSFQWDWIETITNMLNWQILFLIWSLVYFGVHFFERYSSEEIKNLKWEASRNEMELNKLKSQLNPHFIFNAMNTIRALVDEDPKKAKRSITQLSNILRNTLQMGRKKTVSFAEELKVVSDYIDLEKTRFEERLQCTFEIDPDSYRYQVPALMIQTLIENGIKHGISHLPEGGNLVLRTRIEDALLHIEVENSGQLNGSFTSASGFGLANTRHRLQLLYGEDARFEIQNKDGSTVLTEVVLPNETRI
ncbi:MAG: histidine kinase [Leptolyngbya sp. SIO3F4]|nr:histidine kinase [Leptolyngbya sp. SIO3F4]